MNILSSMEMSIQDEINNVKDGRPHVVILGSGASVAALPNGDKFGRILPTMDNFTKCINLENILLKIDFDIKDRNFEEIFSQLYNDSKYETLRINLEDKIRDYFVALELPDEANLYDYLILSLRKKDIICTFNWDPFLIQAYQRNSKITKNLPALFFLHGNVMTGHCLEHKIRGAINNRCSKCGKWFAPSNLLYPITNKNYENDLYIKNEWEIFDGALNNAIMITIFGYGAPKTDVTAIKMMKKSWGNPETRDMEEVEIIDIKSEDILTNIWNPFIHSHHYRVSKDFFNSWIIHHPRRSIEAYFSQFWDAKFIENNAVPIFSKLKDLQDWYSELLKVEIEKLNHKD